MSQARTTQYLESRILTAPPHRLHLMLIEGAIRFGAEAEAALRRGDELAADAPSMRLLDILGELLAGVRQNKSALNTQIGDLYLYLFRVAGEAKVNANADKLAEVLKLLDYERQTWQLVCEKLGNGVAAAPPGPLAAAFGNRAPAASQGISLQA